MDEINEQPRTARLAGIIIDDPARDEQMQNLFTTSRTARLPHLLSTPPTTIYHKTRRDLAQLQEMAQLQAAKATCDYVMQAPACSTANTTHATRPGTSRGQFRTPSGQKCAQHYAGPPGHGANRST